MKSGSSRPELTSFDSAYKQGRISLDQKISYQLQLITDPQKIPERMRSELFFPVKCGTPIIQEAQDNQYRLSADTQSLVQSMAAPPVLQNEQTYLSPDENFLIHYTITGDDSASVNDNSNSGTPDYVEWVATAADSSWRHEVQNLGYTDPIPSPSQPYHVYILNLEYYYGDTVPDENTTFIRIENDFSENFPPNDDPEGHQQGAIKVTMAHELKHAIQYAATKWQGESDLWTEMDATLMEEVVYDNVNDYYNYLNTSDSIFNNPQFSFYPGSYYHVTWALFFEEKYGSAFWVNVWKRIQEDPTLPLVEAMSRELEGDFAFEKNFTESHLWHFASGTEHSSQNYGFEERLNYPDPAVENNNNFLETDFSIPRESANTKNLSGFTATYFRITPPENAKGEVLLEMLTQNRHSGIGIIAYFKDETTDTRIYTYQDGSKLSLEKSQWTWGDIEYLGLVLTNSNTDTSAPTSLIRIGSANANQLTLSQNYPNPFSSDTKIRFAIVQKTRAQLKIYSLTGQLIKTIWDGELEPGVYEEDVSIGNLASGIYFYRLTTDEESITRKMTLIK